MIAIFGGSFDPPHLGHKNVLTEFLKFYPKTKKIILLPNYLSPFKEKKLATKNQVLEMLKIFSEGFKIPIEISEIEINQNQKNFTIDSLLYFKNIYPNEKLFFLLGEDHIDSFSKWKDSDKILELVQLVFFRRFEGIGKQSDVELKNSLFLNNEIMEISSSEIRANISKYADFIDENVYSYILKNRIFTLEKI